MVSFMSKIYIISNISCWILQISRDLPHTKLCMKKTTDFFIGVIFGGHLATHLTIVHGNLVMFHKSFVGSVLPSFEMLKLGNLMMRGAMKHKKMHRKHHLESQNIPCHFNKDTPILSKSIMLPDIPNPSN